MPFSGNYGKIQEKAVMEWQQEKIKKRWIILAVVLVFSRGLGNSAPIPRINNPSQILVMDLIPAP